MCILYTFYNISIRAVANLIVMESNVGSEIKCSTCDIKILQKKNEDLTVKIVCEGGGLSD